MFRIREIIMANFARFAGVSIPLDGETSVFTGPNGSGKSTTFDAARLVLGSRKLANEKREISEYLRQPHTYTVLAIIASNRRKDGKPAIFRRLALKEEWVTLARVYVPKSQSYESKFLIHDGALTDEEILDRIDKGEGMGEQRYKDRLATIGITPGTLDQIIIRQGKVIEVTNGGPKKLHERVMDHAGASETMTEYRNARRAAEDATRKLQEREDEYRKASRQLDELELALRDKKRYDDKKAERDEHETTALAAEINNDLAKLAKHKAAIPELAESIQTIRSERQTRQFELTAAQQTVDETKQRLADWDNATIDMAEEKRRVERERLALEPAYHHYGHAKEWLRARTDLPSTLEAETALLAAQEQEYLARNALDAARTELDEAASRLLALANGKTAWPAPVAATLVALDAAGITYSCLAHALEPDERNKPMLEAALGTRKYAVEVHGDHLEAALRLAAKHSFPGPIFSSGSSTRLGGSAAQLWNAAGPVPSWLDGFDIRGQKAASPEGVWVATDPNTVLGPEPTLAEIERATRAKAECEARLTSCTASARTAKAHAAELAEIHRNCKTRDEYVGVVEGAGSMPAEYARLNAQEQQLIVALNERAREKERIAHEHESAASKLKTIKDADSKAAVRLRQLETGLDEANEAVDDLTKKTDRALILLPTEQWRARARDLTQIYRPPQAYRDQAERVSRELATMKEPDPEVERQATRFRQRVKEFRERVNEQQETVRGTLDELDRARRQYAVFATQHLEEYKKRFLALAQDFGVTANVNYTAIRHDSSDSEVDNAILEVRVGYNGKEPLLVSGGGFSGGEEILNGLMIQLAMRDLDADGFIMVDQPYDHLDSMNAREVAEHLANARMQVIIAVPSSLSPEHYHGMARGVLFQRALGDGWAPLPEVVAVRGT